MLNKKLKLQIKKQISGFVLCLMLFNLIFSGCGGGKKNPVTDQPLIDNPAIVQPPIDDSKIQGSLNLTEISGESLVVKSATQEQESIPISSDGTFSTTVSQEGTQVLFVLDSQDNLRGLTLSTIEEINGKKKASIISIDATSTALSLLFLTPGIATIDLTETKTRISELKQLSSFKTLVDFLKTNLPNKSLSTLTTETEYNDLLINVVEEWLTLHPIEKSKLTAEPSLNAGFQVTVKDRTNLAKVITELSNWGWRYVNVYRSDLDENLNEKKVTTIADGLSAMGGGVPLSWGSIFTEKAFTPTKTEDNIDFSGTSNKQTSQYWITGPGFAAASDTLPSSIDNDNTDAWGKTIIKYMVFPIMDVVLGVRPSLGESDYVDIWKLVKAVVDFKELISSTDKRSIAKALINIAITILKSSVVQDLLVSKGIITAVASVFFKKILTIFSIVFGIGNGIAVATALALSPPVAKIEINNKIPTVNISSPTNNSYFIPGEAIYFTASGNDASGNAISDDSNWSSIIWTSDKDGEIGRGKNVTSYNLSSGIHTITLSATDIDGAKNSNSVVITVYKLDPNILSANTTSSGCPPLNVTFTIDYKDNNGLPGSYKIDYGDSSEPGSGSIEANVPITINHTYNSSGLYNVMLYITNSNGLAVYDTLQINVDTTVRPSSSNTKATGTGDYSLKIKTFNNTSCPIKVQYKAGDVFKLSDETLQDMVLGCSFSVTLDPGETDSNTITAYCMCLGSSMADAGTSFTYKGINNTVHTIFLNNYSGTLSCSNFNYSDTIQDLIWEKNFDCSKIKTTQDSVQKNKKKL